MSKEEHWCEHIHNWGNSYGGECSYYFVDTHSPFSVDGNDGMPRWSVCPICKKERIESKEDKLRFGQKD